jgi:hypothetical protein
MTLDDLPEYSIARVEDLDEIVRKLRKRNGGGPSTSRNTLGLPYNTGAVGDPFKNLEDTIRT